jgi:hypothetical protein
MADRIKGITIELDGFSTRCCQAPTFAVISYVTGICK